MVMALPAAAATAATLAYLSARWRLPVDYQSLSSMYMTLYKLRKRGEQDRFNAFFLVEENALNSAIADKTFILYDGKSWTFKQYYDCVLHYAGWLHSTHNVARGDIVALGFMNCPEMLILTAAIWSLGAIPALVNYNLVGETLVHSLQTSTARLYIVEQEVAEKVLSSEVKVRLSSPTFRNNAFPMEIVVFDDNLRTSLEYFKPFRAPDSTRKGIEGSHPAALMSTSGTSGMPKQALAVLTRFFGAAQVTSYNMRMQPVTSRQPDTLYVTMPFYHATALAMGFGNCMITGCTLAIGRRFSVSQFWPDVRRYNATAILYVGETLRYLVAAPAHPAEDKNHKVRIAGGNGCRPDVWNRFKTRFGVEEIMEFYGATESPFASFNINRNSFSDGAVGHYGAVTRYMLSKTLAIVKVDWERDEPWRDPDTGLCVQVPIGEAGELLVKIDPDVPRTRFHGYHNNEKASQQKVLHNVFVEGDMYFRSGDVLRWDRERRLWFSDRLGDTFRWKSENVSTAEVGEVLGYHDAVAEANVYGVKVPGHEGRAGCAAILFQKSALEESTGGTSVKPEVLKSLATHVRNSLQRASVPVFIRSVTEMMATGNHKSIKHVLRNEGVDVHTIQNAGSGDQLYWLQPGAESYIKFGPEHWNALNTGKARL